MQALQDSLREFRRRAWWRRWRRVVVGLIVLLMGLLLLGGMVTMARVPVVWATTPATMTDPSPVPTTPRRPSGRFDLQAGASVATTRPGEVYQYWVQAYNFQTTPMTVTLDHTLDPVLRVTGVHTAAGPCAVPAENPVGCTLTLAGFRSDLIILEVTVGAEAGTVIHYAARMQGVQADGTTVVLHALPIDIRVEPGAVRTDLVFLPLVLDATGADSVYPRPLMNDEREE